MTGEPQPATGFAQAFADRVERELGAGIHAFYRFNGNELHLSADRFGITVLAAAAVVLTNLTCTAIFIAVFSRLPIAWINAPILTLLVSPGVFWLLNFVVRCGFQRLPVLVLTPEGVRLPPHTGDGVISFDQIQSFAARSVFGRPDGQMARGPWYFQIKPKNKVKLSKFLIGLKTQSDRLWFPALLCGFRSQHRILVLFQAYVELLGTAPETAKAVRFPNIPNRGWHYHYGHYLWLGLIFFALFFFIFWFASFLGGKIAGL